MTAKPYYAGRWCGRAYYRLRGGRWEFRHLGPGQWELIGPADGRAAGAAR